MRRATKTAAMVLGSYTGLLGMEHGIFEILQGNRVPNGVMIQAIGPPCQTEAVWHACLPAMTLVPNFRTTGILATIVGLITVLWAVAFVQRKRVGWALIGLSVTLMLVGGGFVPTFVGLLAGAAGISLHTSLNRRPRRRFQNIGRALTALWPWPMLILVAWFPGGWVLGDLFNQALLSLGAVPFLLFDVGLPLLTILTAWAHDVQKATDPPCVAPCSTQN